MHSTRRGVVYVVTTDPVPNGNAVLSYLNDGARNPSLLPGSPFKTNDTGYTTKHVLPHFGPFDLDQNLMLPIDCSSPMAVQTIAIFDIFDDGSLQPVPGSPFPSGGKNPVSIGLAGDNKAGTRALYDQQRLGHAFGLRPVQPPKTCRDDGD